MRITTYFGAEATALPSEKVASRDLRPTVHNRHAPSVPKAPLATAAYLAVPIKTVVRMASRSA